ncbi:unnamed protein product [Cunninghamella blakesleeana]
MTESFEMYDEWMQQDFINIDTTIPTILLVLKEVPPSLKDGMNKIIKYVPYSNVKYANNIHVSFNGWLWYLKFKQS